MSNGKNINDLLVGQMKEEVSFRKEIIKSVSKVLLGKDTPKSMKIASLAFLLVGLAVSATIFFGLLHAISSSITKEKFNSAPYLTLIFIFVAALMVPLIFLIFKAHATEQAARLDHSFQNIYNAKHANVEEGCF